MKNLDIASNYSKALIEFCGDNNQLERTFDELSSFWDLCNFDQKILGYLSNLFYSSISRREIIYNICSSLKLSKLTERFILICFTNSRIENMGAILSDLKSRLDQINNIKIAEIFSISPLSESDIKLIEDVLSKKFSSNFIMKNKLDASLIGGVKIFFDNQIIDMSVAGLLAHYKNFLTKES
jgi:F-type H+-transporting ATPase subunit delta